MSKHIVKTVYTQELHTNFYFFEVEFETFFSKPFILVREFEEFIRFDIFFIRFHKLKIIVNESIPKEIEFTPT